MSKMSIDQLRAAFKKPESSSLPNNYYRFYDMKVGESTEVRFLPDLNENNPKGFVVENLSHNLTINGQKKTVPCLKMYGEDCPICKVSSEYYKAEGKNSVNGKKYLKNTQNIAQVLVVNSPIAVKDGEVSPVGQVKLLGIGYSLYKIINDAFGSGDLDEVPFDYERGTNFVIKKDKQGEYANYSLSKFARRESALTSAEIEHVKANLIDLSTVLPKNPGREKIEAMLEADLTGTSFSEGSASSAPVQSSTPTSSVSQSEDLPFTPDDDVDAEAERMLADIRARKAAKAKL